MYRYNAAVKYCKELKESGKLGDIFSVEAQMSVYHDSEKRKWLNKFNGGMMFFLGCHLVDIVSVSYTHLDVYKRQGIFRAAAGNICCPQ